MDRVRGVEMYLRGVGGDEEVGVCGVVSNGTISTTIGRHIGNRISTLGRRNVSMNLTMVVINRSPTSGICITGGGGTYSTLNVVSRRCTLPRDAARRRLLSLVSALGGGRDVGNVLYRLPLPGRLSRSIIVGTVSTCGSISTFRPMGINGVVRNSFSFIPYAPTKVVRVLDCRNVSITNGGYIMVNEDGVINGPVSVLLLRGGNAIAVYRDGARGLGRIYGGTSVLMTTINEPGFMATSVIGSNTIMVSIKVGHISNGLVNSIGFSRIYRGASCVAPIPNNINPVAVTVLVRGALITTGGRGGIVNWVGGLLVTILTVVMVLVNIISTLRVNSSFCLLNHSGRGLSGILSVDRTSVRDCYGRGRVAILTIGRSGAGRVGRAISRARFSGGVGGLTILSGDRVGRLATSLYKVRGISNGILRGSAFGCLGVRIQNGSDNNRCVLARCVAIGSNGGRALDFCASTGLSATCYSRVFGTRFRSATALGALVVITLTLLFNLITMLSIVVMESLGGPGTSGGGGT